MGQILSDEGDVEEAINSLIDALRWDPRNSFALLMMGNILARSKDDVPTAMKYYNKSLEIDPNDNIAINNIGANLMQVVKTGEAKKYFEKALEINPDYPNTYFALSMVAEMAGDLDSAFRHAITAIKKNSRKDGLFQNSVSQAFSCAKKIIETGAGKEIVRKYIQKLEKEGGKKIIALEDEDIPTAAKIEFAENYNRKEHVIKFKAGYPAVEHLQMHELVHLDLVNQARKEGVNQLFISTQVQKSDFIKTLEPTINKLHKMDISEQSISEYCSSLFDGLNLQVYNTPIDIFIEDFLHDQFPELNPYQFISEYALIKEGIKATTDKQIVDLSPGDILSKSKIYNLVNALLFKDLYGIDLIKEFKATPTEMRLADKFYQEFLEYRYDKEPGEEYELVLHWAQDLSLDRYFELVEENQHRKKSQSAENLMDSLEKDPLDLESDTSRKENEMKQFQESQERIGTNMAVVMFMVDALEYFKDMPLQKIKGIAQEIAMLGTQGFRPDQQGYRLALVPGKKFSGYHILAWYYISWKLSIPEMLSKLGLPYDGEYNLAVTIFEGKKNE
jgi:Flp pilus assembly protein TadD